MVRSAIFLVCVFGLALGCAHSHDKFYYVDGKICAELKSTVLGTGEIEKFVTDSECVTEQTPYVKLLSRPVKLLVPS